MAVDSLTMLDDLGDVAAVLGCVFMLLLALILAWFSTHVDDRGDHILATIFTAGAHTNLISLLAHDSYMGPASSAESTEQQSDETSDEDKQEDEEEEGGGEGTGEELLDIQRWRKKKSNRHEQREDEESEDEEDESASITVRLKFLNDTEELAVLRPQDTVGVLKSKYFAGRERQIKLIYKGQLLQDPRRTLLSLNITHNSVLHCLICQPQSPAPPLPIPEDEPHTPANSGLSGGLRSAALTLSTGSLVVPVFVVLLAVVWYFRFNYRQLFTVPATASLVGVTLFFSFLIFGMHSR